MTSMRTCSALLAAILVVGFNPGLARAEESAATSAGLGAASALCSLVYGPVKVAWALGGAIISPFAWAFSGGDSAVMQTVINRAVRGDYVVTPEHLTGKRRLDFIGRDPALDF